MSPELKEILWYLGVTVTALIIATLLIAVLVKIYNIVTCGMCHSYRSLRGKTVLITGANTGIGRETALALALRNARVIMACRDLHAGQGTASDIMRRTGNRNVEVKHLDVSSLYSVRAFAQELLKTEQRLDILIHNAGIIGTSSRVLTADNIEVTLATNHLGPFLLTHLLLDLMKKSAPSRIINVASCVHGYGTIDFDNLNGDKGYGSFKAYCNSNLARALFTKELTERLKDSGVTANFLHPGLVDTKLYNNVGCAGKWIMKLFLWMFFKVLLVEVPWWAFEARKQTQTQGAQTSIHLAVSESLEKVSGSYFVDCEMAKESPKCFDTNSARQLWNVSMQMCQEVMA